MSRWRDGATELLGPVLLVALVGMLASRTVSTASSIEFRTVLVYVAIVVSLYVFVGNSGVISFGQ